MEAGQELVPAQPEGKKLTQQEVNEARKRAFATHTKIVAALNAVNGAKVELAKQLWEFHDQRGWLALGHPTLEDYLAQPEIGMSRDKFFRRVQVHQQLVVGHKVAPARLSQIPEGKVFEVMPAIVKGEVKAEDALDDAEALGRRDLRQQYAGKVDITRRLEASEEPERCSCPGCGKWMYADDLKEPFRFVDGEVVGLPEGE